MSRWPAFVPWLVVLICALPAASAEKVVLRMPDGRLLHAVADSALRAESFVPAARESFELFSLAKQQVAVKGPDGRWLVADTRDGCTPRLDKGPAEPGDRETLELVPIAAGRYALRWRTSGRLLILNPGAGLSKPREPPPPGTVPPGTVMIYRIGELPAIVRAALPVAIQGLAAAKLAGKQYDRTRKQKVEKYVRLPDPTLKDPGRTKPHQVLGLSTETRVQAKIDGQIEVRVPVTSLLASCAEGESKRMLVAVEAVLPVQGRVQYEGPVGVSASTGYRTTVLLSAVAEVPLTYCGKDLTIGSPALLDLKVSLSHLRLSNDLLDAVHRQVEHIVNHELRHNEERIREQANQAIGKAISSHEVRIPLLGYLNL